ncbi:hypothetical protein BC941DRAFT_416718 [Chlamydoabsidia padenii]|nr:hypothetical protein BC941DRAFT_416718 [Chlamydoabsidia padenii]
MALNRPDYRDAKTLRAVTVYTIAQESRHLVFTNIPSLSGTESILQDLLTKCGLYGNVETWHLVEKHQDTWIKRWPQQPFTLQPLVITFSTIDEARWVKRKMDDQNFYANLLQVNYAPEYDTLMDLRVKLADRRARIYKQLDYLSTEGNKKKKRKQMTNDRSTLQITNMDPLPTATDPMTPTHGIACYNDNRMDSSKAGISHTASTSSTHTTKRRRI